MSERKIQELLKKFLEGRATPREERVVEEWYKSLSEPHEGARVPEGERKQLRDVYWNSLKARMNRRDSGSTRRFFPGFFAMAAAIVGILVVASLYFQRNEVQSRPEEIVSAEDVYNDGRDVREIDLSDGSKVKLFPGSRLKFDREFNRQRRDVQLRGEAFFDIARDEQRPFYVYTGEVITKVLGTSFSVRAYPADSRITVSVTSGKVSVYTQDQDNKTSEDVILTPNQEAVYTRMDQKVARKIVEEPRIIIDEEEVKKIRFEGAAPADIFRALEKMYGVEIEFEEDKFSGCTITTSVNSKDLYERIDVICEITGSQYEIQGTRIFIEGPGCN